MTTTLYSLKESPSLKGKLGDADWLDVVWSKAVALATAETGLDVYPESGIWETQQILSQTFYPD